jgi:uncharacterized protein (DUF488 family)
LCVIVPTIYTIGYTKKSLEQFIHLLQHAGVDAVVDIRLRNTSQLAGFAKREDLRFLLRTGFAIEYEPRLDLAPTPEIMDAYKATGDWPTYERDFLKLLAERDATTIGRELLATYRRLCLLCTEATPEHCHRRLVAEWWAEHLPDIEILHLH